MLTRRISARTQAWSGPHRAALTSLASPHWHRVAAGARAGLVARGIAGGAAAAPRAPRAPAAVHRALLDVAVVSTGVGVPKSVLRARSVGA